MKIDVQFRELQGEIIAVFPYMIEKFDGEVLAYAHNGGHFAVANTVNYFSKPAKDYEDLKRELESIGYDLNIIKRRVHKKYLEAYNNFKAKRYEKS